MRTLAKQKQAIIDAFKSAYDLYSLFPDRQKTLRQYLITHNVELRLRIHYYDKRHVRQTYRIVAQYCHRDPQWIAVFDRYAAHLSARHLRTALAHELAHILLLAEGDDAHMERLENLENEDECERRVNAILSTLIGQTDVARYEWAWRKAPRYQRNCKRYKSGRILATIPAAPLIDLTACKE